MADTGGGHQDASVACGNDEGARIRNDASDDHEDEDEDEVTLSEAADILNGILVREIQMKGDLDECITYEEFYDRFWLEFQSIWEEEYESVCDEELFEEYYLFEDWLDLDVDGFSFVQSSYLPGHKPLRYQSGEYVDYERCRSAELKRFVNERRLPDPYPNGLTLKYFYIRMLEAYDRAPRFQNVDYKSCTPAELKRLISQRGLEDPQPKGLTLKYFYIRTLAEADRALSFDFMGLPAEMRLMVYRCLLSIPLPLSGQDCNYVLHPNILRTSKSIYKEAIDVLYEENVYSADFQVSVNNGGSKTRVRVHRGKSSPTCQHSRFLRMPAGIDDYPDFFCRIRHLQVNISYHIDDETVVPVKRATSLNHLLYTLASFLMDRHNLMTLRLLLNISGQVPQSEYRTIFFPLRRLRNIPKLIIEGTSLPTVVERTLQRDLPSDEPVFNTMRYWNFLQDQAVSQAKLEDMIRDSCDCDECFPCQSNLDLQQWRDIVENLKVDCCLGSKFEEEFLASLAWYDKALKRVDVTELENLKNKIVAQRKAMGQYMLGTDDGRAEEARKRWLDEFDYPPLAIPENMPDVEDWPEIDDSHVKDSKNGESDE